MRITTAPYNIYSFHANENETNNDKNPISKAGERATLLKATVVAGFGFGVKALFELLDGDFLIEDLFNASNKILRKQGKQTMTPLKQFGLWGLLIGGFVLGMAALYTLVKTPEVMYKGKVNAFVKGKDMDVYIKGNKVEKELYNQMNEKAKNSSEEEKKALSQQYLKLKAAKNQVPDSVIQNTK